MDHWASLKLASLLSLALLTSAPSALAEQQAEPMPQHQQELNARNASFDEAVTLMREGRLDDALARLDALIALHQADPREASKRYYCASNQVETLFYLLKATKDRQDTVVLPPTWADSLFLRGYILIEQQRHAEARAALQQAVELSPSNSQYLGELAQLLARTGEAERALELFAQAKAAAEFSAPEQKAFHLARALRGQGYALIELQRYDEAEAAYRTVLASQPNNRLAQDQLRYIAMQRVAKLRDSAVPKPRP